MRPVRLAGALLSLLIVRAPDAAAVPAPLPSVRPIAPVPIRGLRVRSFPGAAYNAPGHVLIGWTDAPGGADVLTEFTADGATVWECRIAPAGALLAFTRGPDGATWLARRASGGRARLLAVGRRGEPRGGFECTPAKGAEPVRVTSLRALPDGGILVSLPGWAFERDRKGRTGRQLLHQALRSAAPLSDGRWLVALADPFRFAVYDHRDRTFAPLPVDALCQVWDADAGREIAPDRWRFRGCFCVPQAAERGAPIPRKTMEFVDLTPGGDFLWSYGSPRALRVEEFGVQRCATFTREVVDLPGGRLLVLDGSADTCAAQELDAAGGLVRSWLQAPPTGTGDPGTFGERVCGLVGAELLGWTRTNTMTP